LTFKSNYNKITKYEKINGVEGLMQIWLKNTKNSGKMHKQGKRKILERKKDEEKNG